MQFTKHTFLKIYYDYILLFPFKYIGTKNDPIEKYYITYPIPNETNAITL